MHLKTFFNSISTLLLESFCGFCPEMSMKKIYSNHTKAKTFVLFFFWIASDYFETYCMNFDFFRYKFMHKVLVSTVGLSSSFRKLFIAKHTDLMPEYKKWLSLAPG